MSSSLSLSEDEDDEEEDDELDGERSDGLRLPSSMAVDGDEESIAVAAFFFFFPRRFFFLLGIPPAAVTAVADARFESMGAIDSIGCVREAATFGLLFSVEICATLADELDADDGATSASVGGCFNFLRFFLLDGVT